MDVDEALTMALRLETGVWEALVSGDRDADERALAEDFLGVYPTGFAGRGDHVAQLAAGPTVSTFEISEPRCIVVSDDAVLIAYDARYTRGEDRPTERMFVSSLWSRRRDRWVNTFSQDTPATPSDDTAEG